jgi:hypothetical protein
VAFALGQRHAGAAGFRYQFLEEQAVAVRSEAQVARIAINTRRRGVAEFLVGATRSTSMLAKRPLENTNVWARPLVLVVIANPAALSGGATSACTWAGEEPSGRSESMSLADSPRMTQSRTKPP